MRSSKYDKYVVFACIIIFVYSFFIVGYKPIYESEWNYSTGKPQWMMGKGRSDVVAVVEYPTSITFSVLACLLFLCLWVFKDELRPVDRHWVKRRIISGFRKFRYNRYNEEN